jgi:HEAT repeat protein
LFGEALELTRQISSESHRAWALRALAKKLPTELFGEALELTRQISDESHRASALRALAEKQPELFGEARQTTIAIRDPYHRAAALDHFTDPTSWQTIATDQNQNLLRLLSTRDRKHLIELLPKLHPTLLQLGGQPAVDAAIEAMRDACNQWP